MALADAVQNARHSAQSITWTNEGTAVNLTGATLTGVKRHKATGVVTALDGTLTLVTPASGVFSWTYGATDVGAAGLFEVQFIATFADTTVERTIAEDWRVHDAHAVPSP